MTIPLRLLLPTGSSCQPEPSRPKRPWASRPRGSYLALLPVGLAVPSLLPRTRWALTPPFHPYLCMHRRSVFCGAIPRVSPAGRYPAPSFCGVRTFLACVMQTRPSSHPRNGDLGGYQRLVNGEAAGKVCRHRQIHLVRSTGRPRHPWTVSQTERGQQGFIVTICGHPKRS